MIKVYHSAKLRSSFDPDFPTTRTAAMKTCEHVADVDTDDLEKAYMLTNHIDWDWYKNKGVTVHKESRSSSAGDVFVKDDGTAHIVAMIGFNQLD